MFLNTKLVNSAYTRDEAENLVPNRRLVNCEVEQFNGVIEINSRTTIVATVMKILNF